MPGNLQPLDQKFPIVTSDGRPTLYFIKWAQQKQIDISAGITEQQALEIIGEYLADHQLQAGSGITLSPSGNISDSPTVAAEVQAILDQITNVQGSILFRGAAGWEALAPGTAGYVLSTNGAGADPSWIAGGGGGGGGGTLLPFPDTGTMAETNSGNMGAPAILGLPAFSNEALTVNGIYYGGRSTLSGLIGIPALYDMGDPTLGAPTMTGATLVATGPSVAIATANILYRMPFTTPFVTTPGHFYGVFVAFSGATGTFTSWNRAANIRPYFNAATYNPAPSTLPTMSVSAAVSNTCIWTY